MSRYFTRARKVRCAPEGDYNDPLLPHLSVPEHVAVDTGLIDQRGDPIMRAPEPCGFHHPRDPHA
jgi:hypothetical protein